MQLFLFPVIRIVIPQHLQVEIIVKGQQLALEAVGLKHAQNQTDVHIILQATERDLIAILAMCVIGLLNELWIIASINYSFKVFLTELLGHMNP